MLNVTERCVHLLPISEIVRCMNVTMCNKTIPEILKMLNQLILLLSFKINFFVNFYQKSENEIYKPVPSTGVTLPDISRFSHAVVVIFDLGRPRVLYSNYV